MPFNGISKILSVTLKLILLRSTGFERRIDKSNQDRTDLVELIDSYFLDKYKAVKPLSDATINTESCMGN